MEQSGKIHRLMATPETDKHRLNNDSQPNILQIRNLKTFFSTPFGLAKAVNGVSWSLARKETLGIVGESGCGKSVTALSILKLVPCPPGQIRGRRDPLRRKKSFDSVGKQDARHPREQNLYDFSGPHVLSGPRLHRRRSDF